jgi:pimeloyl-ACP methyl ester carboxylesterase
MLHGFPSSSHMFRDVIPPLAEVADVVAPDLAGFGFSAFPAPGVFDYTFENLSRVVEGLIDALGIDRYFLYLFDFGAPVGYYLATRHPERVLGLIVQNGNAHEEGLGPQLNRPQHKEPHRFSPRLARPLQASTCVLGQNANRSEVQLSIDKLTLSDHSRCVRGAVGPASSRATA